MQAGQRDKLGKRNLAEAEFRLFPLRLRVCFFLGKGVMLLNYILSLKDFQCGFLGLLHQLRIGPGGDFKSKETMLSEAVDFPRAS